MNRWLHKLTKKEIWQLHHDVICEDSLKKCVISKGINEVTDETEVECSFYENWHDGEKNCYIPTSYTFKDFDYTDWETSGGNWSDIISGINQESVFSAILWDGDKFGTADPEDHEYFTDYIERYAALGADIYLLEYTTDKKLIKQIDEYCEKHDFKYYASDSLELV